MSQKGGNWHDVIRESRLQSTTNLDRMDYLKIIFLPKNHNG